MGRPRLLISKEHLQRLIEMDLLVSFISTLFGVSTKTLHRQMQEWDLAKIDTHSKLTDGELDNLVLTIKSDLPNSGK